jgi:hypothetical protein
MLYRSYFFNFPLEYAIRKVQKNQMWLKLNETYQLLVYVYDVNLLSDNTDTIILLEQIESQPPSANHRQLRETSVVHALHSSKSNCDMNGYYATDKKELLQNRKAWR